MAAIVPSEVVRYIDEAFAWAAEEPEPKTRLTIKQIGRCSAIVTLIDRVPHDLMATLPLRDFTDLVGQHATLRGAAAAAIQHGKTYDFHGKHVWRLRHLLNKCKDEAPGTAAGELRFIRPKSFRDDLRRDITEAHQSLNDRLWKSATVLAGAAAEALLVWRIDRMTQAARQAAVVKAFPAPKKTPTGAVDNWKLWQLIAVVEAAALVSDDCVKLLRVAQSFRNLIHPGRTVRTGERCGKDTALGALAALERVIVEVQR